MIKNHADFKRRLSSKDTRLVTLALCHGKPEGKIKLGATRHVKYFDTTGVYLATPEELDSPTKGSFLGFDKASDWTFEGDIATHVLGMKYHVLTGVSQGS